MSSYRMRLLPLLAVLLCLVGVETADAFELWIYVATNLQVDKNVDETIGLMERAAKAGYTHVLLADSKLARLGTLGDILPRYTRNTERVKAAATRLHLEVVPSLFHIGYSNAMLFHDPNLVEGPPVKELPLVVEHGAARVADQPLLLPSFGELKKWTRTDRNVAPDQGAAKATANGENARIVQHLRVQPWRQYHVTVRVKTQDLQGALPEVKAIAGGRILNRDNLGAKGTQDWTTHHVVFNSYDSHELDLYFGEWGAKSGYVWWSDPQIEEVAFVNLIRRGGCPLIVSTADGRRLREGIDFEPLKDPELGNHPWPGEYDVYHAPPPLRTKLPDGTRLLASYYHAVTVYDGQAMVCPSEPKTMELLRDEARRVHQLWGAKGYMMSHDECRVMNWCAACQQRGLTPGQLLADNVRSCAQILREVNPGGRIYVWSDMFDPNHNAVAGPYYLVNGPLTGSWEGLGKDVIVLPWYFEKRAESLKFFAERGNRQVIAGYYDSRPERVKEWLAAGVPVKESILGVMYTTWKHRYGDLESFAGDVRAARP